MFKLIEKYNKYSSSVFGENIYLYSRNIEEFVTIKYFKENKNIWEIKIEIEDEYQSLSVWENNELCFLSFDEKINVLQKSNGEFLFSKKQNQIFHSDSYFIEFIRDKLNRKRGDILLYKINRNEFSLAQRVHDVDKSSYFNIKDKLFSYSRNFIKCLSNKEWELCFSDLVQSDNAFLHSKVLSKKEKLFFIIDGDVKRGLYILSMNEGKKIHYFKDLYYEIFTDNDFIYTTKFENILCRINATTNEIEEWDVNNIIIENCFDNIHDHRCAVKGGQFYFTQTLGDNKAKFGILDFKTKQLIYKYEFEPKNGGIADIQVSNTRIFIQTQDDILHVFENSALQSLPT